MVLLPNAPQFGKRASFSGQKVPQSKDYGALQDGTLQCSHQNAAHTMGEKQHSWRCVFKCWCGAFFAFFLRYTV